jgi:hypothetical protein
VGGVSELWLNAGARSEKEDGGECEEGAELGEAGEGHG